MKKLYSIATAVVVLLGFCFSEVMAQTVSGFNNNLVNGQYFGRAMNRKTAVGFSGVSGSVNNLSFKLMKVGSPGSGTVELRQGSVSGLLLFSKSFSGGGTNSHADVTIGVTGVVLDPTVNYWLVFSAGSDDSNFYILGAGNQGSLYGDVSNGSWMTSSDGSNWSDQHGPAGIPIIKIITTPAAVPPPVPAIQVVPTSIDFGADTVGQSAQRSVKIKNTGGGILTVSGVSTGNAEFTVLPAVPPNVNLNAGDSLTVTVTFTPASVGAKTATLTITHNATGNPTTVALTGSGVAPAPPPAVPSPMISVPAALLLDSTSVSTFSSKTLVISNTGTATLNIIGITISGTDSSMFNMSQSSGAIAPGSNFSVNVSFLPTATGDRSATLTITHNATGSPTVVNLLGYAKSAGAGPPAPVLVPVFSIAPASLAMDSTFVGSNSQKTFAVSNTGTATLVVSSAVISGANSSEFAVSPPSANIPAGVGQTFAVTFAPVSVGAKTATLTITHNAAGNPTAVNVSGIGKNLPPVQPPPDVVIPDSSLKVDFTTTIQTGPIPLVMKVTMSMPEARKTRFVFYTGAGDSIVTNPYFEYAYTKAGTYSPKLVVYFEDGRVRTKERPNYIVAVEKAPSIDFSVEPISGFVPLAVKLTVTNTGGPIVSRAVDWGDDSSFSIIIADTTSHIYGKAGVFSVGVTVAGPGGSATKSKANLVSVTNKPVNSPDFTGDGKVTLDDFFLFAPTFGQKATGDYAKFDLNNDGVVDILDFFIFSNAFGQPLPPL